MSEQIIDMLDTPSVVPVLTPEEKAELLAKMMVELDELLQDPDGFWKQRDNQVGYFYQACDGLCTEDEIEAAIEAHLSK